MFKRLTQWLRIRKINKLTAKRLGKITRLAAAQKLFDQYDEPPDWVVEEILNLSEQEATLEVQIVFLQENV
jgi:hypothetical protein